MANGKKLLMSMKIRGRTVEEMAEMLRIDACCFMRKIAGEEGFTVREAEKIVSFLGMKSEEATEIFFSEKSYNMRQIKGDEYTHGTKER